MEKKQRRAATTIPKSKLNDFAKVYVDCGENVREASRRIGVHWNTGYQYLQSPYTKQRVEAIRLELAKRDAKDIARSNKEIIQGQGITKDAIAKRLWELSQLAPDDTNGNINGQVKACDSLSELLGFKVKLSADVTKEFENRTPEELDFFAKNGYFPLDSKQPRPN